jgi:type IX secretion system PorP/SprF family membrane protein
MKRAILAAGLILSALHGSSQQLPQFTQYMFNQYAFNPAYCGVNPSWEAVTNNRYQWLGIVDAPRTFTLSAQGPLKRENMALGGYIYTDNVGPTRRLGFQTSYAYHVKLNENINLSFGLSIGFNQWMLDADKITTYDPGDFYFSNGLLKSTDMDGKFGMYLYHSDWYVGASIEQMLHNKLSFLATQTNSESYMEDHVNVHGGYTFHLGEDWDIDPSALLKIGLPAPLKFDIGVRATYKKSIWAGGGFRTNDAAYAMIGYCYKSQLKIGYSFDFTTTDLRNYSSGTHEVMLGFVFAKSKSSAQNNPSLE